MMWLLLATLNFGPGTTAYSPQYSTCSCEIKPRPQLTDSNAIHLECFTNLNPLNPLPPGAPVTFTWQGKVNASTKRKEFGEVRVQTHFYPHCSGLEVSNSRAYVFYKCQFEAGQECHGECCYQPDVPDVNYPMDDVAPAPKNEMAPAPKNEMAPAPKSEPPQPFRYPSPPKPEDNQYQTARQLLETCQAWSGPELASNRQDGPASRDQQDKAAIGPITTGVLVAIFVVLTALFMFGVIVVIRRRKKKLKKKSGAAPQPQPQPRVTSISGTTVKLFTNPKDRDEKPSQLEEVPRKNIRFLNTIGKGMFGIVVKAEVMNINNKKMDKRWTTVAIKMTNLADRHNEDAKTDFLAELALMKSIPHHVNIITLHGSCTAHDPYMMLLEYAERGDLKKHLQDQRMERNYANAAFSSYGVRQPCSGGVAHYNNTSGFSGVTACGKSPCGLRKDGSSCDGEEKVVSIDLVELVTSKTLITYALQICRALEHLVNNKIVHRDVAARNILLFDRNVVKISDFGLARRVDLADVYQRTRKGLLPVRWMSPESLFYNQFGQMSDVWSYGVFLWELVTLGSTPYSGLDTHMVIEKVKQGELLTCPPHSSDFVNNVMRDCWETPPNKRPTFSQLCQRLEKLLEAQVEYVDLDQMDDHEYSVLDD